MLSLIHILDVCLDSYAIAQEAAVFEQTVDKYVIVIDLARQNLSLIHIFLIKEFTKSYVMNN